MRESIADKCSKIYGMNLQAEDVTDCDGCRANTGRLFSGCFNCEIRKCVIQKNIENCAYCNDYACDRLKKHFSLDPGAHASLEEIRQINRI
jgi:predicted helicase